MKRVAGVGARAIAYLWVPAFGTCVARRADHRLDERPLALLDEGEHVLDADPAIVRLGVTAGMSGPMVIAHCPEARLLPAARFPLIEAQAALWGQVKTYSPRWQGEVMFRL